MRRKSRNSPTRLGKRYGEIEYRGGRVIQRWRLCSLISSRPTDEFLIDNIYESFINNTCKLKFVLKGQKCYKDVQMKACNITQASCYKQLSTERCACKPLGNFLLIEILVKNHDFVMPYPHSTPR